MRSSRDHLIAATALEDAPGSSESEVPAELAQRIASERAEQSASVEDLRASLACERARRVRLEASVEEMTERLRANDLLAAVLAHDLRNPLSGILAAAKVLAAEATPTAARPLQVIQRSGERMSRLIAQLLELGRARAELPLDPAPSDLCEIVDHVVQELAGHDASGRVELSARGDTRGAWDADRLAQLFSNLLGNALQHGEGGRVRVELDGTDRAHLRVRVHNEGTIPELVRGRLFDPWARGARRSGGLGLGLFIARHIARAHGGELALGSTGHDGTTFELTLPREP